MTTTKDQAKPRERCLSRFPHSRLALQCRSDAAHDGRCWAVADGWCYYTWPTALNVVAL